MKAVHFSKPSRYPLVWESRSAKSKETLNRSHSVYYMRYYIFKGYFVCFVRKRDGLVVMKCYGYNILSADKLISSKARRFPRKVIEFQPCGNMWGPCSAGLPPFRHINTSISPAEHDINRRRVMWDGLRWNDNQTSRGADEGKEKSLAGREETESDALLIIIIVNSPLAAPVWLKIFTGFVRSWKTWKSHGILKWTFPGLEKSWKILKSQKFWKSHGNLL